ncbi:hypothetical protein MHYP_G00200490 [Metynnis hypsauchen]
MSEFDLILFTLCPTLEQFDDCRKVDLLLVADFFNVDVPRLAPKREIKRILEAQLVTEGILPGRVGSPGVATDLAQGAEVAEAVTDSIAGPGVEPGRYCSHDMDPMIAVKLKELELEIRKQEREAELIRVKGLQVGAEKEITLKRLSMGLEKPMPRPRKVFSPAPAPLSHASSPDPISHSSHAATVPVMSELKVKHQVSSAYHPESQGALERFHQTFKTMLRSYCLEVGKDWDEGIPLLLFALRDKVQESTGFSPNALVFGRSVRGPLKLLYEQWLASPSTHSSDTVDNYVSNLREHLKAAREKARQNLCLAQQAMKVKFDRNAVARSFNVGDKVLALLPMSGSTLQTRFSGPYEVQQKLSPTNYVLTTPNRRRKSRICHINMLKPYVDRLADMSATASAQLPVPLPVASVSLEYTPEQDDLHLGDPFRVNKQISITIKSYSHNKVGSPLFNLKKAKWDYREGMENTLLDVEPSPDNYAKFVQAVKKTTRAHIPHGCRRKHKAGITEESSQLL